MEVQEDRPNYRREEYLCWEDYFMGIACLTALRSKDPDFRVGACIIDSDKKIMGVGWNGMPKTDPECQPKNNDDIFSSNWKKHFDKMECKLTYVCHAELNAIAHSNANVKGCTMYVTLHPCNECAKLIIQSGIKKIYYLSDVKNKKPEMKAAELMFKHSNVTIKKLKPLRSEIPKLNFEDFERSTNPGPSF